MANRLAAWWQRIVRSFTGITPEEFVGMRTAARTQTSITADTALRNSGVWAALRIRAGLISTFPLDTFRKVGEGRFTVPTPMVLREPGGDDWDSLTWLYATQVDLDRAGNAFGLITAKDGDGFPAEIIPQALDTVTVVQRDGQTFVRIGNQDFTIWSRGNRDGQIWHEKQYVVPGLPVGLSPVAYAASVISENISTQQFAETWFGRKAVPAAHLKNVAETVDPKDADAIRERFNNSVTQGGLFVTGMEWEYKPLQSETMGSEWLDSRKLGMTDIARFFDVPADLIDASVSGESVTYASITERNLQFLIFHLGPAVKRREAALSKLMPRPRYVQFNTDALLRMDPKSRAEAYALALQNRWMTNSEVRALEDRKPLTESDKAEFESIYGAPTVKKPALEVGSSQLALEA